MKNPDKTQPDSDKVDLLIDRLLRQSVQPSADFSERVMRQLHAPSESEYQPTVVASWYVTLGGLAAATVIGVIAFYLLFSNAPEPAYPQQTSVPADTAFTIAAIHSTPLEDLVELNERLRPIPGLHRDPWLMIEALLY
jgi:hypothetical protein